MRGLAEVSLFGAAALALHAGALALWPPSGVTETGGAASSIGIAAASPEVAAMAAAWQAGPDLADRTEVPPPPPDDGSPLPAIAPAAAPLGRDLPEAPFEASPERLPAALAPLPRTAPPADGAPTLAPAAEPSDVGMAPAVEATSPGARVPEGIAAPASEVGPSALPDRPSPPDVAVAAEAPPAPSPSVLAERSSGFPSPLPPLAEMRSASEVGVPSAAPERTLPADSVTAPPGSDLAPSASLRPEAMPDRPAPAPVRAAGARSAARETPRAAASGTGRGENVGAPGGRAEAAQGRQAAAPAGPSAETLQAQWGASVKGHIAGRAAPPRGVSGRVGLVVSVATDGRIAGVGVARSSGDARADRAAAGAVQRVGRVPRAPGGLPPGTYRFAVALTLR